MIVRRLVFAIVVLSLVVAAAPALRADDDLFARFGIDGKRENLFPEPQEKQLAAMREPADRVVWTFRERLRLDVAKADGDGLAGFLAKAVKGLEAEVAWLYTKSLVRSFEDGDDAPLRKFGELLVRGSLPEDAAAFLPVLERLPEEMGARVQGGHCVAIEQARRLEDETHLRDYLARAAEDGSFYRKKRPWMKLYDKAKKGLEGLVDRLGAHFCEENLLRFCVRLSRLSLNETLAARVAELRSRLVERLHEEIIRDFEDRMAGGLVDKVQAIEMAGGSLMMSEHFFSGRLRRFNKRLQGYGLEDLRLFMGQLEAIRRHVTRMARGGNWDGSVQAYLEKAERTLETMRTHYGMKLRKSGPLETGDADRALFHRIRSLLVDEDGEGLFEGLPEGVY